MKKLLAIVASALTLGAFANSAADPVITADTSAVDPDTTCSVMADNEKVFDFATNGGVMAIQIDEKYVGRRVCLAVDGEEITDSTIAQMGAANDPLNARIMMATAAEPVAVWEDLTGADQEGGLTYEGTSFTLSANGNTVAENGTIAIGSTGIKVTNFPENTSAFTIVVKYSGYTAPTESGTKAVIATAKNSANANRIGVYAGVGVTHGIWNGGDNGSDVTGGLAAEGVFALAHGSGQGTTLLQQGASNVVFNNNALMSSGNNYDDVTIGAFNGTSTDYTPSTMTIEKVAVFASKLTQDDVNAFVFPSEDTTEVFDGTLPSTDDIARFQAESWVGTVWIKNRTNWNGFDLNSYGNANSTVRLTGITGYNAQGSHVTPTVELVDETDANGNVTKKALEIRNGWTGSLVIIDKLIGSGTLDVAAGPVKTLIKDSLEFKGVAKVTIDGEAGLIFGNVDSVPVAKGCVYDKKITIVGETPVVIHSAWTAPQGIVVNGTLNVPSTIAKQSLVCDLLVSENGSVNVAQTDWIPYDAEEVKAINVKGALNLGTTRQTLKANNKINVYPGATITGTATGVDGGCHINTFGANCVISMVADGANTEAATISAIIGPQGSAATIDVADGLTLNLAATVSSSGAGRMNGLVKTGTGTLNITGNIGTLAGLTLNEGTISVGADATIPTSGIVTTVEGKKVSVTDGVYTLVDNGPASIEDVTAENVAALIPEAAQAIDATALVAWIKAKSGISTIEGLQGVNVDAFLMNASNDTTELVINEDTLAAVLSGDLDALKAIYPNAEVTIEDVTSTICGEGADENTHLYQLKLSLPTAE